MNRIFRYAAMLLLIIGSASLVSCGEVEPENIVTEEVQVALSVDPASISFTAEGGFESVLVETDAQEWDFMVAASWLEVEKYDDGFIVNAPSYDGDKARNGDIIVYAFTGNVREEFILKVTQEAPAGSSTGTRPWRMR